MNKLLLTLTLLSSVALGQENAGLSVDPAGGNVAALFTMTDEGGRLRNLDLVEGVFRDGSLGFSVERHHNVSSPFIYSRLESLAGSIPQGGTLLVYLNSHGGGSGNRFIMTAKDGNFRFSKALESMGKAGRPLRRLVLLVDTCHAEGSIQDSTGDDGELLRNLRVASPAGFLPEMPSSYSRKQLPFISPFLNFIPTDEKLRGQTVVRPVVDYGEGSGVWDELLIISSSSVEDLSVRGVFASKLAVAFKAAGGDRSLTVGEFLKKFADNHGQSGQQPHYKVLPNALMFDEPLFGAWPAQILPLKDYGTRKVFGEFIPIPKK